MPSNDLTYVGFGTQKSWVCRNKHDSILGDDHARPGSIPHNRFFDRRELLVVVSLAITGKVVTNVDVRDNLCILVVSMSSLGHVDVLRLS